MNPHAYSKYVARLVMAVAAFAGFVFLAGCSSNNNAPVNPQGFTNASLSGTYVFSSAGTDVNGNPINIAGAFTANGSTSSPSITAGTVDIVDPSLENDGVPPTYAAAQSVSSGSYEVSSDGRGQVTLNIAQYGTFTFDFALDSTSGGVISEFDGNGTGSGTLDLQTAITSLPASAAYSFSLGGVNSNDGPLSLAGAFVLNADGNGIASGIYDYNNAFAPNSASSPPSLLANTVTLGSGTAPGQVPLQMNSFPTSLAVDFYPIDATHFKLIETDYSYFLAGDAYTQTGGSSIPTGSMAFTLSGDTSGSDPFGIGGFITVNGTAASGTADLNIAGTLTPGTTFTGTAGTPAATYGRVVISNTAIGEANQFVAYPSLDGVVLMELDTVGVSNGVAVTSASVAPANSTGYAFNLTAVNENGEEDDIAQFDTSSSGGSLTGVVDINDTADGGGPSAGNALSGQYGTSTTTNGAYGFATTLPNGDVFADFNAYPSTSGDFLVLELDQSQLGTGVILAQTTPTSGVVAQNSMRHIPAIVHPRAAKKHAQGETVHQRNVH